MRQLSKTQLTQVLTSVWAVVSASIATAERNPPTTGETLYPSWPKVRELETKSNYPAALGVLREDLLRYARSPRTLPAVWAGIAQCKAAMGDEAGAMEAWRKVVSHPLPAGLEPAELALHRLWHLQAEGALCWWQAKREKRPDDAAKLLLSQAVRYKDLEWHSQWGEPSARLPVHFAGESVLALLQVPATLRDYATRTLRCRTPAETDAFWGALMKKLDGSPAEGAFRLEWAHHCLEQKRRSKGIEILKAVAKEHPDTLAASEAAKELKRLEGPEPGKDGRSSDP